MGEMLHGRAWQRLRSDSDEELWFPIFRGVFFRVNWWVCLRPTTLTHTHLFIDWLRASGKYATPHSAPVLEWLQEQRLDVAMRWEISSDLTEAKRRPRYAAWIGPHAAGRSRS
jgi:hypothetical protein